MLPVIGAGFGEFSYVLGPWTDYFPKQLAQADSQYGVAVGTEIEGGETGAVISAITFDPPFNIAGNNGSIPWRLVVLRGKLPDDGRGNKTLPIDLQLATQGWPRLGESSQNQKVLFSKMISAKTVANAYNSSTTSEPELHFPFPDKSGPSCGPGETLTVLLFPMFNDTGVPGYGANNKSYASFSVWGLHESKEAGSQGKARSIARGTLGQ